jgi:2',3'-cyclic-nucleotide 2'-phosphodiesterase (5'-nucleotidase family)
MQMWRKRAVSVVLSSVMAIGAAVPALAAEIPNVPVPVIGGSGGGGGQAASDELSMKLIGRYTAPGGSTAAEIVSYNKNTHKAYVINGKEISLDIVDLSGLKKRDTVTGEVYSLTAEKRVYLEDLGLGITKNTHDMTSVAVSPSGEYVALAVPAVDRAVKGKLLLLTQDGGFVKEFGAGYLPDMVTFTPDGSKILSANEGEPNSDYSVDPEGSVTFVDLSNGVSSAVAEQISLNLPDDVFDDNVRLFPKGKAPANSTERAQDLEPEYIAVDSSGSYAYVSMQENNAIATLNLETRKIEKVSGLGVKDHSLPGNGLDASDKDNTIHIAKWPVLGMYMPDGISLFQKDGKTYLVTANEGDAREYGDYAEEKRIKDISAQVKLNRSLYKGYTDAEWDELQLNLQSILTDNKQLGRLNVTNSVYTVTGATYYEGLYAFGARSFSIWDAADIAAGPVFDSGSQLETIIAQHLPAYFNASNDNVNLDDRSDNKGPEPEDAEIGVINGKTYAFIGLERIGGVMAYNVTDPAQASFAGYVNSRDFSDKVKGDSGPEGLQFVAAENSPTGKPLLLVGNEVSGTVAVFEVTPNVPDNGNFPLTVLHTNDTHANIDSSSSPDNVLRRVTATKLAKSSSPNPLLLDAGDVFAGTLYFNEYEGQADLEFMNLMQYDAMTFGNHEFDKGSEVLSNFIKNAQFPFVSANVDFSADDLLKGYVQSGIGHPGESGQVYPAIIKEIGGQQVGIFGLTTVDTANISSPGVVTFQDPEVKAKGTVAMLQQQGINKIIAVSHLGYDEDRKIAAKVEGIDIIVGGHSHTKLDAAIVDNTHSEPKLIVQTGERAQNLGKLQVEFDKNGKLLHVEADAAGKLKNTDKTNNTLIAIDQKNGLDYVFAADPEAASILAKYKPKVDELNKKVVGQSNVNLYGAVAVEGYPRVVRTKETAIGNLVVDGMLYEANLAGSKAGEGKQFKVQMALQNGGGIRTNLKAGAITQGAVQEILPFNNDVVVLELTGQEIWDGLENGVSKAPSEYGGFPHVAGMKFTYDSTKPAFGRVTSVSVKTDNGYVPLDLKKTYNVATNIFTAKGGDAYTSFGKAYNEGRVNFMYSEQYPFKPDYEVFIQYLEKLGILTAANTGTEGRITDVKGIVVPQPDDSGDSGESEPGTGTTGGTNTPPASNTPDPGVQMEAGAVNGGVELKPDAKDLKTETAADGMSVTSLTLAAASFSKALTAAGTGKTIITLPEVEGAVKVALPVSGLTGNTQGAVLIRTADKSYDLPLSVVKPSELAAALGTAASEIRIEVVIGDVAGAAKTAVEAAAAKSGAVLLTDAVSFTVTAQAGGKHVELNYFGSTYVSRTLTISGTVDPSSATAVVFDPASSSMSFVPAVFGTADGKTVVTMKRNSNSIYGVVKPSAAAFADLSGHWSRPDVELLAAKLVIDGQAPGRFAPDAQVTRGEFAALLVRALGLAPDASSASGVKDLTGTEWYAGALGAAKKAGLLDGFEDGTLRGGANITRAQMAVMMSRALKAAGKPAPSGTAAVFADEGQIPAWAADAVDAGVAAGLVEGTSGNRFAPEAQATRAEAATMLKRLLKFADFIN